MLRLPLVIVFVLFACTKPAPVAPSVAPQGRAIDYARMLMAKVECVPLGGDAAICDFGRVLAYCHVGGDMVPGCDAIADLRPKKPEPKQEAPKPEQPETKPVEVEAKKPDAKPPAKK